MVQSTVLGKRSSTLTRLRKESHQKFDGGLMKWRPFEDLVTGRNRRLQCPQTPLRTGRYDRVAQDRSKRVKLEQAESSRRTDRRLEDFPDSGSLPIESQQARRSATCSTALRKVSVSIQRASGGPRTIVSPARNRNLPGGAPATNSAVRALVIATLRLLTAASRLRSGQKRSHAASRCRRCSSVSASALIKPDARELRHAACGTRSWSISTRNSPNKWIRSVARSVIAVPQTA